MSKNIYFAGGCFWGTERVFKEIPGVIETTVGYANGRVEYPSYEQVCRGDTGHRETVKVTYNPERLSLEKLTHAFFMVIDPTVQNRQGPDIGTQYQTGVYYEDEQDLPILEKVFGQQRDINEEFYVELEPLGSFYAAEDYHQDYLDKNPGGYCHITNYEIEEVRALFAAEAREAGQRTISIHQMRLRRNYFTASDHRRITSLESRGQREHFLVNTMTSLKRASM